MCSVLVVVQVVPEDLENCYINKTKTFGQKKQNKNKRTILPKGKSKRTGSHIKCIQIIYRQRAK